MSNSFKNLNNLEGCKQNLRIMLDFYFEIIQNKKGKSVSSRMEYDGGVWLQVFFTKCCSFLTLLDGIEYSKDNVCLKKVVDFPTLFTIARSLYESLVAFEILCVPLLSHLTHYPAHT